MRKSHHVLYLALAVGIVASVALATLAGRWLDSIRPLGSTGVLMFLIATALIFLVVEGAAGLVGAWVDQRAARTTVRRR